jgi:hypothetical protein
VTTRNRTSGVPDVAAPNYLGAGLLRPPGPEGETFAEFRAVFPTLPTS